MSQFRFKMARMRTRLRSKSPPPIQLAWHHNGVLHHVTPWPEVRFEQLVGRIWCEEEPEEDSLAAAMSALTPEAWREYLEYVPDPERAFLDQFRAGRIAALLVLARCPEVFADLIEVPALTTFLAAHRWLRGTSTARWAEINAVRERAGVFGLMEWLGLPASRQTLTILRQIADPDLPIRLLEPLRAGLWEPETIWDLQSKGIITVRRLERLGHALAA